MTVNSNNRTGPLSCNGATTVFASTFKVLDADHAQVIKATSAGVETVLTRVAAAPGADEYTLSGVGSDTFSITTGSTYAAGNTITMVLNVPFSQPDSFTNQQSYRGNVHETVYDKMVQRILQLKEELARSIKLRVSSSLSDLEVPDPEAGKVLKWNSGATALENGPTATEISNAETYATNASASASAASASASAASSSASSASASAAAAAASIGGVKVSADDTTPDDLEAKLLVGDGLSLSTQNGGADETRTIDLDFASQAEAEAGTATDKPLNSLRVSQAIAALAAPPDNNDQVARNRINNLAFRLASLNSISVFEMSDMVLDAFEDETGVYVNNGATYDGTGDYYDNAGAFADGPTATLDANRISMDNYTIVQIIDAAEFSSNSSQVRVTFEGGTSEGFRVESAWIGHPGTGDVYDFDGNQVQLQFGGNDHVEIAVSTTETSDAANFDLDASKNLLIAFEIQKSIGTNNDTPRVLASKTNWSAYEKVASGDTGTTDKTGYSASAQDVIAVNKIEILGAAGNITLISDEYAADAAPDTARTTIWLDPVDSVTINTDAIAYASRAGAAFTTDYAADANQIDDVAHSLSDDDRVAVFSTGTLPAGLTEGVLYYVVNATTDAFELSTSSGGAAVTLTDDGSGTHTWAVFDPVTLVEDVAHDADVTIYAADVDISGQPSGTAMRWAFETVNNKEQRLHGFSLSWR